MGPKERPSVLPAFARTHARFFMFSVILFLLVIVPIIAITAVTGAGAAMFGATQGGSFDIQAAQSAGIGAILIIIYLILAAYFYGRLSLVLPASAVGEEGYTFAWAWRHSRGNGFKIMLAFIVMGITLGVIAAVYFTIAGLLLSGLAASGNVVSTIVLGAAILSPAYIIMTALFISLLSVIFQELSGYQPPWERE